MPSESETWEDEDPPPRPFISIGEALRRLLPSLAPVNAPSEVLEVADE